MKFFFLLFMLYVRNEHLVFFSLLWWFDFVSFLNDILYTSCSFPFTSELLFYDSHPQHAQETNKHYVCTEIMVSLLNRKRMWWVFRRQIVST